MGHLDPSPIPPYAVTMWRDDRHIYVALPMTAGGIPYITRFALSEGGLSAALEVLRKRKHEVLSPTEAQALYAPPTDQPQVKVSKFREKFLSETSPEQREAARLLLVKLGIKP